jgi:hypothetical protein
MVRPTGGPALGTAGGKGVETGGEGGLGLMAGRTAARMRGGGILGAFF